MDKVLRALHDALEDELERQEIIRAVCIAQNKALRARNVDQLRTQAEALDALIAESLHAHQTRLRLADSLFPGRGTPAMLTELAGAAPEPWRSRLSELQERMQAVFSDIRDLVRLNGGILRRALQSVNRDLATLTAAGPGYAAGGYGWRGLCQQPVQRSPRAIDAKG